MSQDILDLTNSGASDRRETELVIAEIWGRVLEIERVEPTDNFLLLGGESLLAVQAAAMVKDVLGHEISIRNIFTKTISEISAELMEARGRRDRE